MKKPKKYDYVWEDVAYDTHGFPHIRRRYMKETRSGKTIGLWGVHRLPHGWSWKSPKKMFAKVWKGKMKKVI